MTRSSNVVADPTLVLALREVVGPDAAGSRAVTLRLHDPAGNRGLPCYAELEDGHPKPLPQAVAEKLRLAAIVGMQMLQVQLRWNPSQDLPKARQPDLTQMVHFIGDEYDASDLARAGGACSIEMQVSLESGTDTPEPVVSRISYSVSTELATNKAAAKGFSARLSSDDPQITTLLDRAIRDSQGWFNPAVCFTLGLALRPASVIASGTIIDAETADSDIH